MASQLGIAPMTVSQVYKELKEVGLLETKQGNGTFVSSSVRAQLRPEVLGLQRRIDQLLDEAMAAGLSGADLAGLVNARINRRTPTDSVSRGRGLQLIFVGLFDEATRAYGVDIRAICPRATGSRQRPWRRSPPATSPASALGNADLVLTLFNRKAEVAALAGPKKPVLGVQLHSLRAHPHPARPDRSPGARSASSPPSRSSCPS